MAISAETLTCPQCGANLFVQNGKEYTFCIYCGTKVMLRNDNIHIYRNYDEAKIRQAETERMVRLREMEIAEKEKERERIGKIVAYSIAGVLGIAGTIICMVNAAAGAICIFFGVIIAEVTLFKGKPDRKERRYVGPDEVVLTEPMLYYEDRTY